MLRFALLFAFSIALLLTGCGQETAPASNPADTPAAAEEKIPFRRDGTLTFLRGGQPLMDIALEIADTDSARTRGMMQRTGFPDDRSGMLFIFDREAVQSFWMANTPVALDLLFISADSQVVDIHKYARPFSADNITGKAPARFVLEVPAGFTDREGITETDRVWWERRF